MNRDASKLDQEEDRVLVAIRTHHKLHGNWPSQNQIEKDFGFRRGAVGPIAKRLENQGKLVRQELGKGQATLLHLPAK